MHVFLTSALVEGYWPAALPGLLTSEERTPGAHWIGGWVGPRTGLDNVKRRRILPLPGLELQPLSRPTHSQTL
jgi:hypothetical protein